MAELERQLLLSPQQVRGRHADRLEALALAIRPDKTYTHEFTYFRVTGFRPTDPPDEAYQGVALRRDLLRLLDTVSATAPAPVQDVPEPVLSLQQVADRCNVSVRTAHRWRHEGLVSRKYLFPDGRRRTGVREKALTMFLEENRERTRRSRRFSRLRQDERAEIVRRARVLAQQHALSATAAAEQLAAETGRAKETIRQALLEHDRRNPRDAVFGRPRGRATDDERQRIYEAHLAGQSVPALCARFGLSRASIYRLLNEARARSLLEDVVPAEPGIQEDAFAHEDAEEQVSLCEDPIPHHPPMEPEQERRLLRLYNYLKFRISALGASINPSRYVRAGTLDEIETLAAGSRATLARLLVEHLPLLIRVARQHAGKLVQMEDLVSEGMLCLLRAADSFDYTRDATYSSYASWALMREFARTVPEEQYEQTAPDTEGHAAALPGVIRRQLEALVGHPSEEQVDLVRARFGIEAPSVDEVLAGVQDLLQASADASAPDAGT